MARNRILLTLHPISGGSFTQLSLSGPVATVLLARELRRLLAMLAWSGSAVGVALDADAPANWLAFWTGTLNGVRERAFRVRFHLSRPGKRGRRE